MDGESRKLYPGSAVKTRKRRSFRTPIQTLPLPSSEQNTPNVSDKRRSASKSFLISRSMMSDEEGVTPKTMIQQLANFDSGNSTKVHSYGRESVEMLTRKSDNDFKVPPRQKRRKISSIGIINTPDDRATPRTAIEMLLANSGEEYTPVIKSRLPQKERVSSVANDLEHEVAISPTPILGSEEVDSSISSRVRTRQTPRRSFHIPFAEKLGENTQKGVNENSAFEHEVMITPILGSDENESSGFSSVRKRQTPRRSFHIPFAKKLGNISKDERTNISKTMEKSNNKRSSTHLSEFTVGASDFSEEEESLKTPTANKIIMQSTDFSERNSSRLLGKTPSQSVLSTGKSSSKRKSDLSFNQNTTKHTDNTVEKDDISNASLEESLNKNDPITDDVQSMERNSSRMVGKSSSQSGVSSTSFKERSSLKRKSASSSNQNTTKHTDNIVEKDIYDMSSNSSAESLNIPVTKKHKKRSVQSMERKTSSRSGILSPSLKETSSPKHKSTSISSQKTTQPTVQDTDDVNDDFSDKSSKIFVSRNQKKDSSIDAIQSMERNSLGMEQNTLTFSKPTPSLSEKNSFKMVRKTSSTKQHPASFKETSAINNRKISSFFSQDSTKRTGRTESSTLEPLQSSTPRREKSDSFFHSTRRQSTMGSYLSHTREDNEGGSMSGLHGVSPIRADERSKFQGDEIDSMLTSQVFQPSMGLEVGNEQQRMQSDLMTDDSNIHSTLKTPYIDMNKKKSNPSSLRKKQTQLTSEDTSVQQNQKKKNISSKPKSNKEKKPDRTLPRSSVKFFAERHTNFKKLSPSVVEEIENVSEEYWANTFKALEVFALHAGRKTVTEADVVLLMKTQGIIKTTSDLHDLIREYLPVDLQLDLIPVTKPCNTDESN